MPKDNKKIKRTEDKDFNELLKEREQDNGVDESLKEIYEDESSLIPVSSNSKNNNNKNNMGTMQRRQIDPWTKIAWTFLVLLLVLSGISWTSFFILNEGTRLDIEDIEFNINGPSEVIAGQEVVYEIQYKNLSKFNLKDVDIYLTYPDSFVFLDAAPAPTNGNNTWQFEQVDTKRSGRIEIKGQIIAVIDTEAEIIADINYRPENFSSTFGSDAAITTKVSSTGLSINVATPSFFNVNEEAEIVVNYAKQKESFIDNFRITLEHSDNFVISGDAQSNTWEIANVPDMQEELIIKGAYIKKPTNSETLKIVCAVPKEVIDNTESSEEASSSVPTDVGTTEDKGEPLISYYSFYEEELLPIVIEGALNLSLAVNGSTADKPINSSDVLNYVVHYKNASEANLKNVIIMAIIDSAVIDWQTLDDKHNGEVKDNAIIWTKEEISGLAEVSPDQEDSFGFSIQIKPPEQIKDLPAKDWQVITSLDYSIDSAVKSTDEHAAKIVNKINSNLRFNNELRYFDRNNVAVGTGPLPPKVGEKTSYQVYWILTNSLHDLENIDVSTELPENIKWENEYSNSMGTIGYNNDNKRVSWKIGEWDAVDEPAIFEFTVSVTPTEDDRNKILTILNQSRIEAKDKETGGIIVLTAKAKTSNLEDDEVGEGYGKVE